MPRDLGALCQEPGAETNVHFSCYFTKAHMIWLHLPFRHIFHTLMSSYLLSLLFKATTFQDLLTFQDLAPKLLSLWKMPDFLAFSVVHTTRDSLHRIIINWLFFFLPLLARHSASFIFVSSVPNPGPTSSYLLNGSRRKEEDREEGKICLFETIKHYRNTKNY